MTRRDTLNSLPDACRPEAIDDDAKSNQQALETTNERQGRLDSPDRLPVERGRRFPQLGGWMPDGPTVLGCWHAPGFRHGSLLCEKGPFRPAFRCGLLIVNALQLVGCAAVPEPPRQTDSACAILAEKPYWDRAMRTVKRRWGVPVEVQLAIIRNESSFRHDTQPRSPSGGYASSAYGYPQAIGGTWQWYRDETGQYRAKQTDFADAADFIGWYTNRSRRVLAISQGNA